jgi:negative regulator of flagellin synthesis FlgM
MERKFDMRIDSTLKTYEVYNAPAKAAAARASRAEEKQDMVALSQHAKDFRTAKKTLDSIPDVREDKVNSVKSQIESGTYNVSAKDAVDKIFMNLAK